MSSTWIRVEIAARTGVRRAIAAGGTPATSAALAAVALAFQAGALALGALASPERAVHLRSSWAFGALALVVACDAALSVARFLPPAWAARRSAAALLRAAPRAALSAAYALAALALVASWWSHSATTVRLAVGEAYGQPGQVVGVEGPSRASAPPPRLDVSLERVEAAEGEGGRRVARSAVLVVAGRRTVARRWWPASVGAGTLAFAGEAGIAPRFELLDPRGGVLESAFAKLDVLPPGRRDVLTFERVPHRAFLELRRDAAGGLRWAVQAFRGKVPVGWGTVAPGEPVAFDGIRLVLHEGVSTVTLRLVRDRGIPLAVAALLAAALALVLAVTVQLREEPGARAGGAGR